MLFDAAGEYILTCGEKHVRVLHNVTGYKTRLHIAKSKLNVPGNSQATKERLQKTIEESENFLSSFSEWTDYFCYFIFIFTKIYIF